MANKQIPPAELDRWAATLATMQECDAAAGITDKGTVAATAAYEAARDAAGRRS